MCASFTVLLSDKSKKGEVGGKVARMDKMRNAKNILGRKSVGRGHLLRSRNRWKNNAKVDLK
jgi:hypothetical protein